MEIKTFEQFLQKHFGLVGPIWKSDKELEENEDNLLFHPFTEEADEAWDKATELIEDLCAIGAISKEMETAILVRFCDLA